MARVSVHLPLNISRTLGQMLKEYAREIEKRHGIRVEIDSQIQCQPDNASQGNSPTELEWDEANLPDLVIGHIDYFSRLPDHHLEKYFRPLPGRFPIRAELAAAGFEDPQGYFHPFTVIPFAIIYNPNLFAENELPRGWEDLLDPRWRGKICMPDQFHMAPKMIRAYIQANYPEKYDAFLKNLDYQGAPINVINAVDEGRYPLGITNISFARISRSKNICMLWPQNGMICMPMMMVWSKKADDCLLEIGEFILSRQVQEYLAMQTFVPASADVAIPQLLTEHNFSLRWKSWDDFRSAVKGSEE